MSTTKYLQVDNKQRVSELNFFLFTVDQNHATFTTGNRFTQP